MAKRGRHQCEQGTMLVVEIRADKWKTAHDFVSALKDAIGAPSSHGDSPYAFVDSMVVHDEINALKSPYTIKTVDLGRAHDEAKEYARLMCGLVNEAAAPDRGTDLEVTMVLDDSN